MPSFEERLAKTFFNIAVVSPNKTLYFLPCIGYRQKVFPAGWSVVINWRSVSPGKTS